MIDIQDLIILAIQSLFSKSLQSKFLCGLSALRVSIDHSPSATILRSDSPSSTMNHFFPKSLRSKILCGFSALCVSIHHSPLLKLLAEKRCRRPTPRQWKRGAICDRLHSWRRVSAGSIELVFEANSIGPRVFVRRSLIRLGRIALWLPHRAPHSTELGRSH